MAYRPNNDKKWRDKNPEVARHGNARRGARCFVNKYATLEELDQLQAQIEEKRKELLKLAKDDTP